MGDAVADSLEGPGRRRRGLFGWRKRAKKEPPPLTHCENCGAELHGHYCAKCGQAAVDYRRSFRHVIADVADSFLNWDSKFVKTIGILLIRPGWLTNQFLAGRRARYLHPLRLYLLVSIAFFLCGRLIPINSISPNGSTTELSPEIERKVAEGLARAPNLPPETRDKVNQALARAADAGTAAEIPSPAESVPAQTSDILPQPAAPLDQSPTPKPHKKNQVIQFGHDEKGPQDPFGKWIQQRAKEKLGEGGTNVQLFVKTLRDNISTMMLFCIPLFAFVLKILYIRKHRFYIEHLVYALHIHSFFYMATMVSAFCVIGAEHWAPALQTPLTWILSIAVVVQVFLSIRQVYRQGWFMTMFKFFFGGFIYLIVLFLAFAVTAFATIALP